MIQVAVIILNYNSVADCRKCVGFLQRQEGVKTEILIVDNCSPLAGELQAVQQLCEEQGCTFLPATVNRGYNAGNNIALRYAAEKGYKYALIANPDMEFHDSHYLLRLTEEMVQRDDVAVVASDIVTPEGIHQNPMKRDGDWRSSFGWITSFFKKKQSDTYDFIDNYRESHYCSKVSGCCLMVRLDFMQQIDFFDEGVFLYCEEAILAKQVERAGLRMFYTTEVQAVHAHIKSEKGDPVARFKHWKRSRFHYIDKYSTDSCWGRMISKFSMTAYVLTMTLLLRLKR